METNEEKMGITEKAKKALQDGLDEETRAYWEGVLDGSNRRMDEDIDKFLEIFLKTCVKPVGAEDVVKVVLDDGAVMPAYAHDDDAGLDLFSTESNVVHAHGRQTFKTGVHMEIPYRHFGAIRAKSGLLRNHGIICSGTVDCSYTGEIMVTLVNTSDMDYQVFKGDKIAQMILIPYYHAEFVQVDKLDETERGDNGFGSTGR